MKKIYFVLSLLLCSCGVETNTGEKNVKEFVKSKIDMSIVDDIEVQPCDSLPSVISVTYAYMDYMNGTTTTGEFMEILAKINNSLATKGAIKYDFMKGWLRKAYTVVVKRKDGKTTKVEVIMDEDGVTPVATGGEICKEIERYINSTY